MSNRYVAKEMDGPFNGYVGVWDTQTRTWATWNEGHSVPLRYVTHAAAQTTATNMNNGVPKE